MSHSTPLKLLAARLLYKALDCKIGLVVTTSDPVKAKAIFYRFRREIGDPLLMSLKIYISPTNPTSELWLLRTEEEAKEEASPQS